MIDALNLIWRANTSFGMKKLHFIPPNVEKDCICGEHWDFSTNSCPNDFIIIFNFFRNLRPLIEDFKPDKCFFVLEGHPQFRYDLFSDYKANRIIKKASKVEEQTKFKKDSALIIQLMQCLPITICRASNYEADDTVAMLCENMKNEDLTVLSSDSDYIQLLQRGYSNIRVYNPIKKIDMEAPPYPYVAWKCLNGDKSDNIPALLKPKKALDTINNPELFKKFMDVEENRANFNVNRQLIEFRPVPEEEIILKEGSRSFENLKKSFQFMKFESIVNDQSWLKFKSTFDCLKY